MNCGWLKGPTVLLVIFTAIASASDFTSCTSDSQCASTEVCDSDFHMFDTVNKVCLTSCAGSDVCSNNDACYASSPN